MWWFNVIQAALNKIHVKYVARDTRTLVTGAAAVIWCTTIIIEKTISEKVDV